MSNFSVAILCLFVFANAVGVAPIAIVVMGEIFAQNIKDMASGISMTWSYTLLVANSFLYPYFSKTYGPESGFGFYGCCTLVSFFFVLFFVPETKGKTFQEIQILME